jgi:hypothetical protein
MYLYLPLSTTSQATTSYFAFNSVSELLEITIESLHHITPTQPYGQLAVKKLPADVVTLGADPNAGLYATSQRLYFSDGKQSVFSTEIISLLLPALPVANAMLPRASMTCAQWLAQAPVCLTYCLYATSQSTQCTPRCTIKCSQSFQEGMRRTIAGAKGLSCSVPLGDASQFDFKKTITKTDLAFDHYGLALLSMISPPACSFKDAHLFPPISRLDSQSCEFHYDVYRMSNFMGVGGCNYQSSDDKMDDAVRFLCSDQCQHLIDAVYKHCAGKSLWIPNTQNARISFESPADTGPLWIARSGPKSCVYRCDECKKADEDESLDLVILTSVRVAQITCAAIVLSLLLAVFEGVCRRPTSSLNSSNEVLQGDSHNRGGGATTSGSIIRVQHRQPESLWRSAPLHNDKEFTDIQYTGILTPNPGEYATEARRSKQELRVALKPAIKICIVITAYNEPKRELARTLRGVLQNLRSLVNQEGFDFWERFAVCFVFDGRHKASSSSLQFLSELGIYNSDILLDGKQCPDVHLHLLEFTAQIPATLIDECIQKTQQTVATDAGGDEGQEEEEKDAEERCGKYFPPLQTIFALKEHNGGKLNSHLWAFNALCSQMKPDYVVLLDVGTEPLNNSIGLLYHRLQENRDIAGICGQIVPMGIPSANPLVAARTSLQPSVSSLARSLR